MSLYTWSVASDVGTAAYLNAMFSALMTNLGNGGWAQTLDSGQINLTTNALYPSSANQSIGYQIWQMQDGLQTTYPIFIKFEFGSAASASIPAFWLTIGTSSDGAGNITGILFARTQYSFAGASATAYAGFISCASNRFLFFYASSVAGAGESYMMSLERTHSPTGSDTGDGLLLLYHVGNFTKGSQYISRAGFNPVAMAQWDAVLPPSGNGVVGSVVNVFPVRCWNPGETAPSLQIMAYDGSDLTVNSLYTITGWDGNAHSFLSCPGTAQFGPVGYGGSGYPIYRHD